MAIPLANDLIEELRIHNSYRESQCTIVNAELIEKQGTSTSSRERGRTFSYHPRIQLLHEVDRKPVTAFGFSSRNYEEDLDGDQARAFIAAHPAGTRVACFYDPGNPSRAVLIRDWGDRRRYLLFIPTGGAVLFGTIMTLVLLNDRRRRRK